MDGDGVGTVSEVELSGEIRPPESLDERPPHFVLLRWNGRPVGRLVMNVRGIPDRDAFRRAAMEAAAPGLGSIEEEEEEEATEPVAASCFSVIIATRDRPEELEKCLARLSGLDPAPGEIIVVDSASESKVEVAETAEKAGALYVRLEKPGLSMARNAGAEASARPLLAFIDDDCRVDAGWLRALGHGFSKPGVDAVAGQLLPEELDTSAQSFFLHYSHMDRRGFVSRTFHRDVRESRYWPLDVWRVGSGGNLALRREVFRQLGGFDTSLGLGTLARGGEDLFFLYQLLRAGKTIAYRPDAVAWHRHHRSLTSLEAVMSGYGIGHTAYLRAAHSLGAPSLQLGLYRLSFYFDRLKRVARCLSGQSSYPVSLVFHELAGSLRGARHDRR